MADQLEKSPTTFPIITIQIKQEKLTPPPSPQADPTQITVHPEKTEPDDKKVITPIKSSNELLDELFQAFSAVVPESLLSVSAPASESTRKKHKKEKKAKKSKHKERLVDDPDNPAVEEPHHKRVKVKKEKRSKRDKSETSHKPPSDDKSTSDPKPNEVKIKVEKRRIGYPDEDVDHERRLKRVKHERCRSKERTSKADTNGKTVQLRSSLVSKPTIVIKSLKDSTVIRDAEEKSKTRIARHHKQDHRHRDGDASDNSNFSLSDEETYMLEQDHFYEHDRRDDRYDKQHHSRVRSRDRSRRSTDRHDRHNNRRTARDENRFYASRDR